MTVSLLTYANRAKVAEALTRGGYPVTRMTVNRWAGGAEMPGIARTMILRLFGHQPDAAPSLEQQLAVMQGTLRAIAIATGVPMPEIEEMDRRVAALERSRQQHVAGRPTGDAPARGG